ncbi:hypothetical protein H6F86_01225 [Phormidium sp. FACHB-592]|uniref:STAS/SEC14 domain-containing protein n=1 Tax=Stenomitos frigidus AS-A4 TaxID=2933935 RepID=A0ABV0KR33_9CYAN|nr:hypothetical protein [Phormidium sp. FACHB-592]MBD2072557.1 hypothetical protein [Phormidium sp. FACHB-592]
MMTEIMHTTWNPTEQILRTRISGVLNQEQVEAWEQSLEQMSRQIPKHLNFTMLVDIQGYEVSEQDKAVHQQQRVVIPTFLARHGFEVGFFRLFEVQNTIPPSPDRARCVAVAHVHHDCNKMALYNQNLGRSNERFFCQLSEAEAWLGEGIF